MTKTKPLGKIQEELGGDCNRFNSKEFKDVKDYDHQSNWRSPKRHGATER